VTVAVLLNVLTLPARTPSLAVPGAANEYASLTAAGNVVAVTWAATPADGDQAIYTAVSTDGGRTFARPVRVGAHAAAGGEQPPRIALVPARTVAGDRFDFVVVWSAKAAKGTRLLTARSRDGGRTFSAPAVVAGTDAAGNRGWHSVAVNADGHPIVLWLDHRDGASTSTATHHHQGPADQGGPDAAASVARAAASRLYVGSTDGSVPVQPLVHGVCYCCKTAMAVAPGGEVMTAWRHVYGGGYRDIAFSRAARDGRTFTAPARVSEDGWQIAGCPEDGPALAVDAWNRAHVVWPALTRENGRETMTLFHAVTADGRTFSRRVRLPAEDAAFHPQAVVTPSGELVVTWDEGSSGTRHVRLARGRIAAAGTVSLSIVDAVREEGSHPALAVAGDAVILAWSSRDGQQAGIRVLRQPI
jgi:hypothetical protein